ncbi:MAG: hypothetical protein H5T86_12190, partial [Armatimonadetes bacterium]|nr:hypothetical protein [Armatimonadota bacterium]
GIVGAAIPAEDVRCREDWLDLGEGVFESHLSIETPYGVLTSRTRYNRSEPSWVIERPIKHFERDWPAYRHWTFGEVGAADWSGVEKALAAVGEDYLLEVALGGPFFDYIAGGREGGPAQAIFDLLERPAFFEELHEAYIERMRKLAREACAHTSAEAFFIGCSWSCVSVIGPALWRRWDKPVIRAVAEVVHAAGKLLHIHFHGKCRDVLADLAECGADCVCPFERPPGGDITDVAEVSRAIGDRVTMNGNVHTVETLIRGTPADVVREVEEIFQRWGRSGRRLILGTGDQVGAETPEENITAMIEAGRRIGKAVAGTGNADVSEGEEP